MSTNNLSQWTTYRNNALSNTKVLVRSGSTFVFGYTINNPNTAECFVQCFDAAAITDVNLGTTICDEPIKVGGLGGIMENAERMPLLQFTKGLVIVATTTESGSTAPSSPISVSIRYQ
jgi:hypothetical protein